MGSKSMGYLSRTYEAKALAFKKHMPFVLNAEGFAILAHARMRT